MFKTYKYRIYPSNEQQEIINKIYKCQRFVYNNYLAIIKNKGYISSKDNILDFNKNLKYKYPFLAEIDSMFIRKTLFKLDDNIKRIKKSRNDFPKFKRENDKNSFVINKSYLNIQFDLKNRKLVLPSLGTISFRGHRNLKIANWKIITVTITKENTGKYYASILLELPEVKKKKATSIVGIDIGIKKLLTLSDGTEYSNNKSILKYEDKIERMQRELSKKEKGSKNYYKCKKKINIVYNKLVNARKFYIDKITKEIVDNYDIIVCEKLKTKEMIMNGNLSKQILDASFSEIIKNLENKAKSHGKYFYQVDTYYPSSQLCSKCGNRNKKYKDLGERLYSCEKCGNELDRDFNASVNIMFEGLKMHMRKVHE